MKILECSALKCLLNVTFYDFLESLLMLSLKALNLGNNLVQKHVIQHAMFVEEILNKLLHIHTHTPSIILILILMFKFVFVN